MITSAVQKNTDGDEEMAQRLRALDALTEDLSSLPSAHIRWLTTACDSSFGGFGTLFWPLGYLYAYAQTHNFKEK